MDNLLQQLNTAKRNAMASYQNPNDKQYWIDKVNELENRVETANNNATYFKKYEKGVSAYKSHSYPYKY